MLQLKNQLKSLLNVRALTATQLARRSGVPKQTISNWLSGVPPRGISQLKQIAMSLNISLDELCFGKTNASELNSRNSSVFEMNVLSSRTTFYVVGFDGYIKSLTPSLKSHCGWAVEERLARPLMEFVHFEDRLRLHVQLTKHIQERKVIKDLEHRILCKDGGMKWINWNALVSLHDRAIFVLSEDVSHYYPNENKGSNSLSARCLTESVVEFYRFAHSEDGMTYHFEADGGAGTYDCGGERISAAIFGAIHSVLREIRNNNPKSIHVSLRDDAHQNIVEVKGEASSEVKTNIASLETLRHWVKPYGGSIEQVRSQPHLKICFHKP
ncbi:MAG TPA: PAS domain-containing protein [Bdellovibrionota bacterium]|nr:PAS domain-containing protein [Bdellovibrionota bacterium]